MTSETRLFYLRTADRTPVGAVAFTLKSINDECSRIILKTAEKDDLSAAEVAELERQLAENKHTGTGFGVRFSITLCHPDDQFVKKTGRVKTLGRLESFEHSLFAISAEQSGTPPALSLREMMAAFKLPLRKEIDFGKADRLLKHQMRTAYERAGVKLPPPMGDQAWPRPGTLDSKPADEETVH